MQEVGKKGVSAAKWSLILTLARVVLQMLGQVVLARTLGPDAYGVFGMGLVAFMLTAFVSDIGFGMFILQRDKLSNDDIRLVFTWQSMIGLVSAGLMVIAAPWIAAYFHDARVERVVQLMAIACLLSAWTGPSKSLLSRELKFKELGVIEVLSYVVGYLLVGITMALNGYGVMALVAAWVVQALVKLVLSVRASPVDIRPLFWQEAAPQMFATGRKVFATNMVNWTLNNLDRIMIGRFLNAHAVGVYNVGFNLANTAGTMFLGALHPAFLASGARVKGEPERLLRAYLEILSCIWIFVLPLFVLLGFVADDVVAILYGDKWLASGPVLAAIFVAMPAFLTWGLSTPVLWNTDRGAQEPLLQLPVLLVGPIALYFGLQWGVSAAAWTVTAIFYARALLTVMGASRAVSLHPKALLPQLSRGLLLSSVIAGGAYVGHLVAAPYESAMASGALESLGGTILALSLVLFRPSVLGVQASSMVRRLAPRLSPWLYAEPSTQEG